MYDTYIHDALNPDCVHARATCTDRRISGKAEQPSLPCKRVGASSFMSGASLFFFGHGTERGGGGVGGGGGEATTGGWECVGFNGAQGKNFSVRSGQEV
jgi:hypothetical protein